MNPVKNEISYKDKLIDSQSFIKDYVKGRVYNSSDVLDVVQEINRVAIEKESDYNKDFWGKKSIERKSTFQRWISGISKFQVMAFLTRNKRSRIVYIDDFYNKNQSVDESDCPSVSLTKKELFSHYLNILTDREKRIISLLKLGYKQVDIARILEIQTPHVSFYKKKAVTKIKNHISCLK